MERSALITQLLAANEQERQALFQQHSELADLTLAWALKDLYDTTIDHDPALAATVAATVAALAHLRDDAQVTALASWTNGMAAMDAGQLETAHQFLTLAREQFLACQQPLAAASTQISNLRVLAILGRDEEALHWGEWARLQFEAHNDPLATGKIEQNLAILHFRRDRYGDTETLLRRAHEHFIVAGDQKELTRLENNLATVLTAQYKFSEANVFYQQALARAETEDYEELVATLECNLGCFALFQGHFDQALDYLERSRRRYSALQMPHESAIADQEIADAYLEINLVPEAAAIYARVAPLFEELGMRAEQARALAYHGRALLRQSQIAPARALLAAARTIYQALDNGVGEATVLLYLAEAAFLERDWGAVDALAVQTETAFAAVNAWGRLLQARWLRGEAHRLAGDQQTARRLLEKSLQEAQQQLLPQIAHRCLTALGQLAMQAGDLLQAETHFKSALQLIETMRAPLPAEAFRIAFLSDKLTPYTELVRLCLADGSPQRIAEALGYVELARARALLDLLGETAPASSLTHDPVTAEITARIETLRAELNWFYSQINRPDSPTATRSSTALADLQEQAQVRERTMVDLLRQLPQQPGARPGAEASFDLAQLRQQLGADTALVEYFSLDEALWAFIVTDQALTVVALPCREAEVETTLQQFHFQLGALRYGGERVARHQAILETRTRRHLTALYDQLLRPLAPHYGARRLLVAPHRALHYVPFHALHDGAHYVVEAREVCYTPSAAILQHCLLAPQWPLQQALLLGVPDAAAPRIYDEIMTLSALFPTAHLLLNDGATRAELIAQAPKAELLHLACHGRFRADNPLFSALQLADGWLTVHDAAQLNLRCNLVTLSGCETGVNTPAPGDELLGLVRGFLLAGAPALLVSLWTVEDAATAEMMAIFYKRLLAGDSAAAALRFAQCQILAQQPHPFFWAPFVLFGRWS